MLQNATSKTGRGGRRKLTYVFTEYMEQKYDTQFKTVFNAIRQLMSPPPTSRKQIGFHAKPAQ